MTDEVANLVLEQLRHIRGSMAHIELDVLDPKIRMSSLEGHLGQGPTQFVALKSRMDRFDERLTRIERRLDLVSA